MEKRGQVTLFVILAIVIIVIGILIYVFYPSIKSNIFGETSPQRYLNKKLIPDIETSLSVLSSQGGFENPEGFVLHKNHKVKYLCYTSLNNHMCKVQPEVPTLKTHIENEMKAILQPKAEQYVQDFISSIRSKGYTVTQNGEISIDVKIVPEKVIVTLTAPMTISKEDNTQSFQSWKFEKHSKLYELIQFSLVVIDYEASFGDASGEIFQDYYPNIILYKDFSNVNEGTVVYTVQDITTGENFTFASRSNAWGSGGASYGLT